MVISVGKVNGQLTCDRLAWWRDFRAGSIRIVQPRGICVICDEASAAVVSVDGFGGGGWRGRGRMITGGSTEGSGGIG